MTSGSVALWCAHKPDSGEASFEAHINYWRLAGHGKGAEERRDFLEIGVFLTKPATVDEISIYVPTKIGRADIHDCARFFKKLKLRKASSTNFCPLKQRQMGTATFCWKRVQKNLPAFIAFMSIRDRLRVVS